MSCNPVWCAKVGIGLEPEFTVLVSCPAIKLGP